MSDTPTATHYHAAGNGRRWYDPNKVVLILFGIVGFLVVGWGGLVFSLARASETKNVEQDGRIQTIEKTLDKVDSKLDRILERIK